VPQLLPALRLCRYTILKSALVTIRAAAAVGPRRGLADVLREIAAEQRARGFHGRSATDLRAEDEACSDEDAERDRELDAARRVPPGGP
jgi:hypothetical protein